MGPSGMNLFTWNILKISWSQRFKTSFGVGKQQLKSVIQKRSQLQWQSTLQQLRQSLTTLSETNKTQLCLDRSHWSLRFVRLFIQGTSRRTKQFFCLHAVSCTVPDPLLCLFIPCQKILWIF